MKRAPKDQTLRLIRISNSTSKYGIGGREKTSFAPKKVTLRRAEYEKNKAAEVGGLIC